MKWHRTRPLLAPMRSIEMIMNEPASGVRYPKFRNDRGISEIRIGVRRFNCVGVSPPQDHPHVYIDMGEAETILCPYCATRFRFDPRLAPHESDPRDSLFIER